MNHSGILETTITNSKISVRLLFGVQFVQLEQKFCTTTKKAVFRLCSVARESLDELSSDCALEARDEAEGDDISLHVL